MRRLVHVVMCGSTAAILIVLARFQATSRSRVRYVDLIDNRWLVAYGLLCLAAAYGVGLPDVAMSKSRLVASAVLAPLLAAAVFAFVATAVGPWLLPRFVVTAAPLFLAPIYGVCSLISRSNWDRRVSKERVLLISHNEEALKITRELDGATERPASLVGLLTVSDANPTRTCPAPVAAAAADNKATLVVLSEEAQASEAIIEQVAVLHEGGVRVRPVTVFYDEWLGKLPLHELTRMHLMFDIGEVHTSVYGRLKRFVDVVCALLGLPLLVVVSPAIALANAISSRGPLLFGQDRVGLNGKTFRIHKFRTMLPRSESAGEWTQRDDPRITPVGRLLRSTHIDELPQLWNILVGDLSLVGPRPEQVHYVSELSAKIPHYSLRHTVRPGLTGWAQVKYPYGSNDADALEKLEFDLYYLGHQGPGLDVKIVSRTIRSLIDRRGV